MFRAKYRQVIFRSSTPKTYLLLCYYTFRVIEIKARGSTVYSNFDRVISRIDPSKLVEEAPTCYPRWKFHDEGEESRDAYAIVTRYASAYTEVEKEERRRRNVGDRRIFPWLSEQIAFACTRPVPGGNFHLLSRARRARFSLRGGGHPRDSLSAFR